MKYIAFLSVLLLGCVNAGSHVSELHSTREKEMTVGIVQREIRNGMSQTDVAEALGSPNIVSKDSVGNESWIYDRIATEASYSNSSSGIGGALAAAAEAGSVLLLGIGSVDYHKNAGASASTQKTLTVVIKFDSAGHVISSSYHASKF